MTPKHFMTLVGTGGRPLRMAMRMLHHLVVAMFIMLASGPATVFGQLPEDGVLPNCPIMTDNEASSEYFVDFDGKRYYFCCDACIEDFRSDPERFANQKGVVGFPLESLDQPDSADNGPLQYYSEPEGWDWVVDRGFAGLDWLGATYDRWHLSLPTVRWHLFALLGVLGLGLIGLVRTWTRRAHRVQRVQQGKTTQARASWIQRYGFAIAWVVALLMLTESFLLTQRLADQSVTLAQTNEDKRGIEGQLQVVQDIKLEEEIHFGTFITFGFPPRPRAPKDHQPELTGTYYRGNDERLDNMLNGGQYLTVTFQISLETQTGQTLELGQPVGTEPIFMKVKFIRANQTSNGYFTSEYMQRMYLTMQWDRFLGRDRPIADRIDWVETEPEEVWEARFPLPEGDQFHSDWKWLDKGELGERDSRGVVYLCEERYHDEALVGGRYHYGVEYHLKVEDGNVAEGSDLFMGSTYLGRNFTKYQITDEQWLSTEPIPEHAK